MRGVKLVPETLPARLRHILDRGGCLRRQNLQVSARRCGSRHRQFAFLVEGALAPDRAQDDWRREGLAKQRHRHVDAADVNETPCLQLVAGECVFIRAQCGLAVRSGRQITPMRRRHARPRHGFELEHVHGVGGALQYGRQLLIGGRLGGGGSKARHAEEQRAGGSPRQQTTTIKHHIHPLLLGLKFKVIGRDQRVKC
jgi:hypothetical protein